MELTVRNVFIAVIALFHLYVLVLEMFLWTKPRGLKTFRMTLEQARASAVLAKNQGLYNGFLAAGLIWSIFMSYDPRVSFMIANFFLICVIIAGIYGGLTVGWRLFAVQGLPAIFVMFVNLAWFAVHLNRILT
jgi:putative membrane protein